MCFHDIETLTSGKGLYPVFDYKGLNTYGSIFSIYLWRMDPKFRLRIRQQTAF